MGIEAGGYLAGSLIRMICDGSLSDELMARLRLLSSASQNKAEKRTGEKGGQDGKGDQGCEGMFGE